MPEERLMRRQPRQERSQQRVEHLLNVAAQVFEEVGYAAATTNAIAARAGVPIGSLYQFFPNKDALMEALVKRYLDELQREVFVQEEHLPLPDLIDQILDRLTRFHESHAGFRALFLDTSIEHRVHTVLTRVIELILEQYYPELDKDTCRQAAVIWLGITRGIMQLSEPPHALPEHTIRSEIKQALLSYQDSLLLRAGVPLSKDVRHDEIKHHAEGQ